MNTVVIYSCLLTPILYVTDGQKQEVRLDGSEARHCFNDLNPNTQYKISVYALLQEAEGPAVTTVQKTRECVLANVLHHAR